LKENRGAKNNLFVLKITLTLLIVNRALR